jgi:transcriptional regulator
MAREDLHFRLRIPEELKAEIEAAAAQNRRSMTAEIVARLEDSFAPGSALSAIERSNLTIDLLTAVEAIIEYQLKDSEEKRAILQDVIAAQQKTAGLSRSSTQEEIVAALKEMGEILTDLVERVVNKPMPPSARSVTDILKETADRLRINDVHS